MLRQFVILLFLTLWTTITAAQSDDIGRARAEALDTLEEQFDEYVKWCEKNKLFIERSETYELILKINPDHAKARRGLGFRKKKGVWVPPSTSRREPKNLNAKALHEAPDRRAEIMRPIVAQLLALLDRDTLTRDERTLIQQDVLNLDPENERVHRARKEVQWNGAWVLPETANGARRRKELSAIVHASFRKAPAPTGTDLTATELAFGLGFEIAAIREVRVLSTADHAEAVSLAKGMYAARMTFDAFFGCETGLPPGCTIYLLANDGDMTTFLGRHSTIDDATRTIFSQLEGGGIPGTADWAFWNGSEAKRADGIVRMAFAYFLISSFGMSMDNGWIYEGFGLYLTKALVGSRMTWFVDPSAKSYSTAEAEASYAIRDRLLDPATNWMQEAGTILAATPAPDLDAMFAKSNGALSVQDLVCSYAIAAYLLEGYSDTTAAQVITMIGQGRRASAAFKEVLGIDLARLPARVARWIHETNAEEFTPPIEASRLGNYWDALDPDARVDVIAIFREKLSAVDSQQLARIDELVRSFGSAEDVEAIPGASPLEHFDPRVHAKNDPIGRKWLTPRSSKVLAVRRTVFGTPDPSALIRSYEYDWSDQRIVKTGDPNDIETIFANAANGYAPGMSLAIAVVEKALDDGELLKLSKAFDHAYTDRDGGAYPHTTLYQAWSSDLELEMPDVDTLGILHDVFDNWDTWIAPIPGSEHTDFYAYLGRHFKRLRSYRTLRRTLADLYLIGEPASSLYLPTRSNLHAYWVKVSDSTGRMQKLLPHPTEQDDWFADWVQECFDKGATFVAGQRRQSGLKLNGKQTVRALSSAMRQAGAATD